LTSSFFQAQSTKSKNNFGVWKEQKRRQINSKEPTTLVILLNSCLKSDLTSNRLEVKALRISLKIQKRGRESRDRLISLSRIWATRSRCWHQANHGPNLTTNVSVISKRPLLMQKLNSSKTCLTIDFTMTLREIAKRSKPSVPT
jgi:hypothetical protein